MAGLHLCSDGIVCNGLWQACDSGSIYVCASTASITQQSVNRTTDQPASQGGRQAAGRVQTGWSSRLVSRMNHSGSANRPQPDHITATQHPAIYRAAYGCVQGGRGRRREGKAAKKKTESHIKKKTKEEEWWQEGQVWWQCQRMKEEKWSRKGRSKSQGGRTTGGELARGMKCC